MVVKLLTEHHLEFLSLKGGCTGSYEPTLVKIPHCLKSRDRAHLYPHWITVYTSYKRLFAFVIRAFIK